MKKNSKEMSWSEILTQLGIGAAFGMAFLLFVCCSDAFFRLITGQ